VHGCLPDSELPPRALPPCADTHRRMRCRQFGAVAPSGVAGVHTARHRRRRITTTNSPHVSGSQPWPHQKGEVIQDFGTVKQFSLGLSYEARMHSRRRLKTVLDSTWCWTSTRVSSWNSSTPSPSAGSHSVASPWATPG
jgi:hypothetical protein